MATYRIRIADTSETLAHETADLLRKHLQANLPRAAYLSSMVEARHADTPENLLAFASDKIDEARSTCEELRDEMRDWFDNMPDSLQGSDKGNTVEEAASALEEIVDALDGVSLPDATTWPLSLRGEGEIEGWTAVLTVSSKGLTERGLRSRCDGYLGPNRVSIQRVRAANSRSERMGEAEQAKAEAVDALNRAADLVTPANSDTDDPCTELRDAATELDDIDLGSVEFPGMY